MGVCYPHLTFKRSAKRFQQNSIRKSPAKGVLGGRAAVPLTSTQNSQKKSKSASTTHRPQAACLTNVTLQFTLRNMKKQTNAERQKRYRERQQLAELMFSDLIDILVETKEFQPNEPILPDIIVPRRKK